MKLVLKSYESQFESGLFEQVKGQELQEYGEGYNREAVKLKRFAKAYPKGFVALVDEETDTLIGTTDFYPIAKEAWDGLADGIIVEEMLPSAAVEPSSPYIYVASIIVAQPARTSFVGTPVVFRKLIRYVSEVLSAEERDLHLVGVGSTSKGKILLENWGFKLHPGSPDKVDMRPRYVLHDKNAEQCRKIATAYRKRG